MSVCVYMCFSKPLRLAVCVYVSSYSVHNLFSITVSFMYIAFLLSHMLVCYTHFSVYMYMYMYSHGHVCKERKVMVKPNKPIIRGELLVLVQVPVPPSIRIFL